MDKNSSYTVNSVLKDILFFQGYVAVTLLGSLPSGTKLEVIEKPRQKSQIAFGKLDAQISLGHQLERNYALKSVEISKPKFF